MAWRFSPCNPCCGCDESLLSQWLQKPSYTLSINSPNIAALVLAQLGFGVSGGSCEFGCTDFTPTGPVLAYCTDVERCVASSPPPIGGSYLLNKAGNNDLWSHSDTITLPNDATNQTCIGKVQGNPPGVGRPPNPPDPHNACAYGPISPAECCELGGWSGCDSSKFGASCNTPTTANSVYQRGVSLILNTRCVGQTWQGQWQIVLNINCQIGHCYVSIQVTATTDWFDLTDKQQPTTPPFTTCSARTLDWIGPISVCSAVAPPPANSFSLS